MVEPTSKATPSATSWKPGHTAVIVDPSCTATVTVQSPARSVALQGRQHVRVDVEPRELPVALERLRETLQVAARIGEIGLAHLDVVQPHDRVDLDRVGVGFLAHHLAMQLALGRHVDHEVAPDACVAAEPAVGGEPAAFAVARLGLAERGEVIGLAR